MDKRESGLIFRPDNENHAIPLARVNAHHLRTKWRDGNLLEIYVQGGGKYVRPSEKMPAGLLTTLWSDHEIAENRYQDPKYLYKAKEEQYKDVLLSNSQLPSGIQEEHTPNHN